MESLQALLTFALSADTRGVELFQFKGSPRDKHPCLLLKPKLASDIEPAVSSLIRNQCVVDNFDPHHSLDQVTFQERWRFMHQPIWVIRLDRADWSSGHGCYIISGWFPDDEMFQLMQGFDRLVVTVVS